MGRLRPLMNRTNISRRTFISTVAGATLASGCTRRTRWTGGIVGAAHAAGHRLRSGGFPAPARTEACPAVIVGGGIAGLTAAHHLGKDGRDFMLLELEAETGGNAACGVNSVSAYPWGAHYVPLPNAETTEVLSLLEDFGVLTGRSADGLPTYDETMLCADPMERLFTRGRWQEGLLPQTGISADDRRQYDEYFAQMETWRAATGSDGRRAFAIPVDLSSRDPQFTALDTLTMRAFMDSRGWTCAPLRWYVDYSCRDDYGAGFDAVSAWAGVHYFAARNGHAANAAHDAVLTWPEGNGWLARRLAEPVRAKIRSGCIVWNVEPHDGGVRVDYFDLARSESVRLEADAAICAAPRFIAQRIVRGLAPLALEYSPWMVANLTLDALPTGSGAALAWDNVFERSDSLGYIVATHQSLRSVPRETVLTHYWPLDREPPRAARERALARTYDEWCAIIVADLARAHPDIAAHIRHLDVWLWGHGMIRPVPGFIWGPARTQMLPPLGRIFFAHSDMSGLSIFEEACTRGAHAARALLAA